MNLYRCRTMRTIGGERIDVECIKDPLRRERVMLTLTGELHDFAAEMTRVQARKLAAILTSIAEETP